MTDGPRRPAFERNPSLEALLSDVNERLEGPNRDLVASFRNEREPKLFVIGAPRSGTTLFMQWLASSGRVAYPTNLLSRFYGAPLVGARIQALLADPRYQFRDELPEFRLGVDFVSENGKTRGALSPNEFWYFWRRFLPFNSLDYADASELARGGRLGDLRDELNALANICEGPFALKATLVNQNIESLASLFNRALFVDVRRNPVANMHSLLEARRRQYGSLAHWYSFRIREYPELAELDPLDAVAGQVAATRRSIETALATMPEECWLRVDYEAFCESTATVDTELAVRLAALGRDWPEFAEGAATRFEPTNTWSLSEYSQAEAVVAWERACRWLDMREYES